MLGLFSGLGMLETFMSTCYPLETNESRQGTGIKPQQNPVLACKDFLFQWGAELSWQMLRCCRGHRWAPGTGLGASEGSRVRKDFSVEMTFELIWPLKQHWWGQSGQGKGTACGKAEAGQVQGPCVRVAEEGGKCVWWWGHRRKDSFPSRKYLHYAECDGSWRRLQGHGVIRLLPWGDCGDGTGEGEPEAAEGLERVLSLGRGKGVILWRKPGFVSISRPRIGMTSKGIQCVFGEEGGRCGCVWVPSFNVQKPHRNSCRKLWGPAGHLLTSRLELPAWKRKGRASVWGAQAKTQMHCHVGLEQRCQDLSPPSPSETGCRVRRARSILPSSLLDSGEDSRKASLFIVEITNPVVSYVKVLNAVTW